MVGLARRAAPPGGGHLAPGDYLNCYIFDSCLRLFGGGYSPFLSKIRGKLRRAAEPVYVAEMASNEAQLATLHALCFPKNVRNIGP